MPSRTTTIPSSLLLSLRSSKCPSLSLSGTFWDIVQELLDYGISRTIHAVYQSGWRQYTRFCSQTALTPFPLSEQDLCHFAAILSQTVAWKTISVLRYFQIRAGLPDPSLSSFPQLNYILKGIHRSKPDHQQKHRLPITIHLLISLHEVWSKSPVLYNSVMLWAACCLGFFGFLWAGEFTCTGTDVADFPLSLSDIMVDSRDNPQLITVHLRYSKTDTFGVGCYIYLGRTNTVPCPETAILRYLSLRSPSQGPLFIFQDCTPLTRASFVSHLQTALAQAGVHSSSYSGHSFWIGAATAAAQAGYAFKLLEDGSLMLSSHTSEQLHPSWLLLHLH